MSKATLVNNMRLNQMANATPINKVIQAVNYRLDELKNKGQDKKSSK